MIPKISCQMLQQGVSRALKAVTIPNNTKADQWGTQTSSELTPTSVLGRELREALESPEAYHSIPSHHRTSSLTRQLDAGHLTILRTTSGGRIRTISSAAVSALSKSTPSPFSATLISSSSYVSFSLTFSWYAVPTARQKWRVLNEVTTARTGDFVQRPARAIQATRRAARDSMLFSFLLLLCCFLQFSRQDIAIGAGGKLYTQAQQHRAAWIHNSTPQFSNCLCCVAAPRSHSGPTRLLHKSGSTLLCRHAGTRAPPCQEA